MGNNSVEIHGINSNEVSELRKLAVDTFLETYAWGNSTENTNQYLNVNLGEEKLLEELNNPASEFYFVRHGNEIAGYLKLNYKAAQTEAQPGRNLEIERIYVLKKFQGKKIGKLLINKSVEVARANQLEYIWLGVWEKNPNAIGFYHKMGFVDFGTHDFVVGDEVQTDLLLKLNL